MDANTNYKEKKKNLNKAYFKILSNAMLFDCFYLAPGGRPSPRALLLGIPGLGPEGGRGKLAGFWAHGGAEAGVISQKPLARPPLRPASTAARGPHAATPSRAPRPRVLRLSTPVSFHRLPSPPSAPPKALQWGLQ